MVLVKVSILGSRFGAESSCTAGLLEDERHGLRPKALP